MPYIILSTSRNVYSSIVALMSFNDLPTRTNGGTPYYPPKDKKVDPDITPTPFNAFPEPHTQVPTHHEPPALLPGTDIERESIPDSPSSPPYNRKPSSDLPVKCVRKLF